MPVRGQLIHGEECVDRQPVGGMRPLGQGTVDWSYLSQILVKEKGLDKGSGGQQGSFRKV